jgi:hypothetical protein
LLVSKCWPSAAASAIFPSDFTGHRSFPGQVHHHIPLWSRFSIGSVGRRKRGYGAALGAPRSSSAFDSPHQRPAYNRIMARAGWKSFAFVQHNLVVAGIATINPAAVVTVSASLHNFLFRRRFSRILACPTMGRIGGGYAGGERFSLNPRGKALPFTCEHRVPTSVECLSRRDPGSVS